MVCLYCCKDSQVINSRYQKRPNQVWRRRRCLNCSAVWSTLEISDYSLAVSVEGANNAFQPFDRDKLFLSIYESCKHRQTALKDATALTETVLSKLIPKLTHASLPREVIIIVVSTVLKNFDRPAAVHYAAYHPL